MPRDVGIHQVGGSVVRGAGYGAGRCSHGNGDRHQEKHAACHMPVHVYERKIHDKHRTSTDRTRRPTDGTQRWMNKFHDCHPTAEEPHRVGTVGMNHQGSVTLSSAMVFMTSWMLPEVYRAGWQVGND